MNGVKKGDEKGEVTFTGGRGETVVNYVIRDRGAWEKIERLKVGEEIDSDHQSVTVWLKGGKNRREKGSEKEWIESID